MLEGLFAGALKDSQTRSLTISTASLEVKIAALTAPVDVYKALEPSNKIKLIAEIKRRSPSKGRLAEIPDAGLQAKLYETSGAHAISVLTEQHGFGGSLNDLENASKNVEIPLLRKDFISTEYQILEARASGADFILLILAGLDKTRFESLYRFAHSVGLGVLVETHNQKELEIAGEIDSKLIGINTRNLETFETDISLFERLATALPSSTIKVAESSVKSVSDVIRYRQAGADVVLVGEALVTGDPATLIPELISV